jgi:hypothetical protein
LANHSLATKPKRQQRLLDQASRALGKIERHKPERDD